MFGSSPFANAPFASGSDEATDYVSSVEELADASDTYVASVVFLGAYADSTSVDHTTAVAASVFNAVEAEVVFGEVTTGSQGDFVPSYTEDVSAIDTPTVSASDFSAAVVDGIGGVDTPSTNATFAVNVQNAAAVASDNMHGLAPWEVIDDTQTATWQVIKART